MDAARRGRVRCARREVRGPAGFVGDARRGLPAEDGRPARSGPGSPWWRDEWTEELRGLRVVVCFDNNEPTQARECVRRLRAEGVRADRLDLRALGFEEPKGDLNDYLRSGGDPDRLRPPRRVVRRRKAAMV